MTTSRSRRHIVVCFFILFSCLFSFQGNAQNTQKLYNKVQNIYANASKFSKGNCQQIQRSIKQLQSYMVYSRTRVPTSKAYSVNFPKKINNPSIADLARDRIARLKSQYKSCFQPKDNPQALALYNQVQNIYIQFNFFQ